MENPTYILHGYSTRLYSWLLWAVSLAIALTGWGFGWRNFVGAIFAAGAVGVASWMCYWNPRVNLGGEGIEVINPFVTITCAWSDVKDCVSRWGLEILPKSGKPIRVWSIPSRAGVRERFGKDKAPTPINWDEHTGSEYVRVSAPRGAEIISLRATELSAPRSEAHEPSVQLNVVPIAIFTLCVVGALIFIAL